MFVASDQKWFAFRAVFLGDFIWFYQHPLPSSGYLSTSGQATLRRHRGEEKDLNFCIGVPVRHLGPKKGHGRNDHTSPRWDSLKIMVFTVKVYKGPQVFSDRCALLLSFWLGLGNNSNDQCIHIFCSLLTIVFICILYSYKFICIHLIVWW